MNSISQNSCLGCDESFTLAVNLPNDPPLSGLGTSSRNCFLMDEITQQKIISTIELFH